MKKILAFALIFNIFTLQNANALFGSECKKPKSSYANEIVAYNKFKRLAYDFTSAEKKAYVQQQRASSERNYKDCRAKKLLTKSECKAMKEFYIAFNTPSRMVRTEYEKKMKLSLDTAYRIVVNNQKCFEFTSILNSVFGEINSVVKSKLQCYTQT